MLERHLIGVPEGFRARGISVLSQHRGSMPNYKSPRFAFNDFNRIRLFTHTSNPGILALALRLMQSLVFRAKFYPSRTSNRRFVREPVPLSGL